MKLNLFDSFKNKIARIEVCSNEVINIYLCGPTVHDHVHIGNLRPVIVFDVIYRLLLHLNIKVNYVQNITDIDDKITIKALKEQKNEKEISNYYIQSYLINLSRYNIIIPTHLLRVTDYISQLQEFIKALLEKGFAYQEAGEIFFRVKKTQEYGKLSGQNIARLKSGLRKIASANKEDNKDFVLWKKTTKGTTWSSPWGQGRPGWHTECVVFIQELFRGQTIDIHGGGQDLLFPHHENERIQYLAYNNKELSKIWLHIAHINWGKDKMSKSLNNFIFANDFYKEYGPNVLRHLVLNSHFNQIINFNKKIVRQSFNFVQRTENFLKRIKFYLYINKIAVVKNWKAKIFRKITQNLIDNLNTTKTLFSLEKLIIFLNKSINKKKQGKEFRKRTSEAYFILKILGFKFYSSRYTSSTKTLIKEWLSLRENGKYLEADEIRSKLQELLIL